MGVLESPYDWLVYNNQNSTRNRALSEDLLSVYARVFPNLGVEGLRVNVVSGGQTDSRDPDLYRVPGGWTGSPRHNHGNAGDIQLQVPTENGYRNLRGSNPEDRRIIAQAITQLRAAGATGIGYGPNYMGDDTLHVGFGNEAFWSSTQSGRPKVPWAYEAYQAGAANPMPALNEQQPTQQNRRGLSPFRSALVTSESSGDLTAYNNELGSGGRGHGGRMQFSNGRLADAARAGVVPRMTAAEFAQQPLDVQARVEDWHFQDIDEQILDRGLDRYYGQTIGGVQIDNSAIRGMAHLGGIGGAARFLETGGNYNPADAYGTRISDYGQRFSGLSDDPQRPEDEEQREPSASRSLDFNSPLTSEYMRKASDPSSVDNYVSVFSDRLMDRYDSAVRNQEDLFRSTQNFAALSFGSLMPDIKDTPEYGQLFPPGTPLPVGDDTLIERQRPGGSERPRGAPPTPEEVAAAMQGRGGDDVLRGGQGTDQLGMPAAALSGQAAPASEYDMGTEVSPEQQRERDIRRLATQAGEVVADAAPETGGPNQADEAPENPEDAKDWGGFFHALGVGFGQLAAGEPIDMGHVMRQRLHDKMAQEQAELEQVRYEREQERLDRQEDIQRRQMNLQEAQFELRTRAFDAEQADAARPVDFTHLEPLVADNPALASTVEAAQRAQLAGDTRTRDILLGALEGNMDLLYQATEADVTFGPELNDRMRTLAEAASERDPERANNLVADALEGTTEEQREQLRSVYGDMTRPTNLTNVDAAVEQYRRVNPNATEQDVLNYRERQMMISSGVVTPDLFQQELDNTIRESFVEDRIAAVQETHDRIQAGALAASQTSTYIGQANQAVARILSSEGDTTSILTGTISNIARASDSVLQGLLPQGTSVSQYLTDEGIITDPEAFEQLDGATQMLALLMTRGLMENQGSITDEERRNLLRALVSSDHSPATIKTMLTRLESLNAVDQAIADQWARLNGTNLGATDSSTVNTIQFPTDEDSLLRMERNVAVVQRLESVARGVIVPASIAVATTEMANLGIQNAPVEEQVAYARSLVASAPVISESEAKVFYDALTISYPPKPEDNPNFRGPRLYVDRNLVQNEGVAIQDAIFTMSPQGVSVPVPWSNIVPENLQ